MTRLLKQFAALLFARYAVTDNYGTEQYAYSWEEAQEWIRYCAPYAVIRDRLTSVTFARVQERPTGKN